MKVLLIFLFPNLLYANYCDKYTKDSPALIKAIKKNSKGKKSSCKSDKNILLSFDDGPDSSKTPIVLKALKRQGVKASFFISTHRLEGGIQTTNKSILNQTLNEGHSLGSHGHDHDAHDFRCSSKGCGYELDEMESHKLKIIEPFSLTGNSSSG